MTKKDKNFLGNLLSLGLAFLGIYFWVKNQLGGIVGFFVIIIITATIPHIFISLLIPDKQTNKKTKKTNKRFTSTKKKTTLRTTNKKTTSTENPYNVKSLEQLLTYDLKDLSGYDFETLCFHYLKSIYKEVEQTALAKDRGVDIIFVDEEGFRTAVQVKHKMESGKYVINHEINALTGAKRNHKCRRAMFISSTGYTPDARTTANEHGIRKLA
jgi:restriction endonuclease Mrr